jgi:uncharacterized protein YdbL (DUF1318 family)
MIRQIIMIALVAASLLSSATAQETFAEAVQGMPVTEIINGFQVYSVAVFALSSALDDSPTIMTQQCAHLLIRNGAVVVPW